MSFLYRLISEPLRRRGLLAPPSAWCRQSRYFTATEANRSLAVSATLWHRATQPGERKQLFRHIVIVYQQQLHPLLSLWIWVCEHIRCYLRSSPLQHRGSSWDRRGFQVSSGWTAFARHHVTLPFLFSCLMPPGGEKKAVPSLQAVQIHYLVRPRCGEMQPSDSGFSWACWAQS